MADNISAYISEGKIQDMTASQNSLSAKRNDASSLDKDAFLQLLVAQMKYQDPLEPTENTEYISQLATFSQLEEMQNMTSGMTLQRASSLVGNEVICKVTNAKTGNTEMVTGVVDYVVYENNKAFVSVNDSLYSIDDVYEVVNPSYSQAYDLGKKFVTALNTLPALNELTLNDRESVISLRTAYNSMNDYQKSFVSEESLELLSKYERRINELAEAENKTE